MKKPHLLIVPVLLALLAIGGIAFGQGDYFKDTIPMAPTATLVNGPYTYYAVVECPSAAPPTTSCATHKAPGNTVGGPGSGVQNNQLPQGYGDTAATMAAGHYYFFTNAAFTAARTWTLPSCATQGAGITVVADAQRTLTATNTLTLQRAGSDTIDGGTTAPVMKIAGASLMLQCDGTSKWTTVNSNIIGAFTASTNNFVTGMDANGGWLQAQPASSNLSDAATLAKLATSQSFTAGQAVTPTAGGTQTAGGTLTPDFSTSNSVTATFGAGNLTVANATNVKAGQTYVFVLTQDATGSRTVTWGANYKCQGGCATALALSTAAGAKDLISCFADTTTTLNCLLAIKGAS